MINKDYLENNGFKKDECCPIGVNRWYKQSGEGWNKEYWASVTLSDDGKEALYGVINFYAINNTGSQPYDYISEHRYFNGPISVEDFNRFLNKQEKWVNRNE